MPGRRQFFGQLMMLGAGAGMSVKESTAEPELLHVPGEESPHELTLMQWPVHRGVYSDAAFLDQVQQTVATIANAIAEFEPVVILADREDFRPARRKLTHRVAHWDVPTEDLWCRDSGPLFAWREDGQRVVSHLRFNGWGGRQVHDRDGQIAARVAAQLNEPLVDSGLVGEAGGVEHDGHGLLLAHESSWVHDNRNPGMTRAVIEERLLRAYGAETLVWSPGLRDQDITDYHIDSLARFTGRGRVLINLPQPADPGDPFHAAALETHRVLQERGLAVDVIAEPRRRRIRHAEFVASYVNHYVCNGAVITAEFGDAETDEEAVAALKRHYPGREIVALNVDPLGEIGGGIHCATQQVPAKED